MIEMLITVAISSLIAAALYFSLRSALESWEIAQDQLVLQQVSSHLMEELAEGMPGEYGLRDALEVTEGSPAHISTVMPWTDNTQDVYTTSDTFTLNKHIKPGTSSPIAEVLLPEDKDYRLLPVVMIDKGKTEEKPELRLGMQVSAGSRLRFTFHPDYKKDADVITVFRYDEGEQAVFIEDKDGRRQASKNVFGVKITDFMIRYFDANNEELGVRGAISTRDIPEITGVEIVFRAESKNGTTRKGITFIALRNAPRRLGNLSLKEGASFQIANSKEIKALYLTNLSGIDNRDLLVLNARPQSGSSWRLKLQFGNYPGLAAPIIDNYSIEYPPGNKVFTDRPKMPVDLGFNLLTLGPNGLYDYDDDGVGDTVILDGKVKLEVEKMDIGGAAIFARP